MVYIQYCVIVTIVYLTYLIQFVRSAPIRNVDNSKRIYGNTITGMYLNYTRSNDTKTYIDKNRNDVENLFHPRVKRQSSAGAGKFAEAAKMPQIKVFRLFLQLFHNLWADSYIGGSGPFHPDVVKPVLYLFKDKIIAFFFPDPREEHKKKSH